MTKPNTFYPGDIVAPRTFYQDSVGDYTVNKEYKVLYIDKEGYVIMEDNRGDKGNGLQPHVLRLVKRTELAKILYDKL